MTSMLLTRRFFSEYMRRPINLVLLILVPVIFVALASGALVDFAKILGGGGDASALGRATAGWAASFLAGVAGFFHVRGSGDADRRLAASGMGPGRIVVGRLLSGLVLVVAATVAAIGALFVRVGITEPGRVFLGAGLFSIIYLGIGVAVGAAARSDVNGSLVVIFVWMIDVFLGPGMGGGGTNLTRVFPTHYATLVMMGSASGHAGVLGDAGWAGLWMLGALVLAIVVLWRRTRGPRANGDRSGSGAAFKRLTAGTRYGFIEYRRNVAMWVLLVLLPFFFISLSFAVTPASPAPVKLTDGGVTTVSILSMQDVHGAIMVPITVAFLAGLAGLFVVQGSREGDRRLALAGFRAREILAARLGVIMFAAALVVGVSLAVTALRWEPAAWTGFIGANLLVAATYGMLGVLVGAAVGKLGGLYLMFLLPFIDVGLAQNPMFGAAPPAWGIWMPSYGSVRLLVDTAFTSGFDQSRALIGAMAWLVGLTFAATALFHQLAEPERA